MYSHLPNIIESVCSRTLAAAALAFFFVLCNLQTSNYGIERETLDVWFTQSATLQQPAAVRSCESATATAAAKPSRRAP